MREVLLVWEEDEQVSLRARTRVRMGLEVVGRMQKRQWSAGGALSNESRQKTSRGTCSDLELELTPPSLLPLVSFPALPSPPDLPQLPSRPRQVSLPQSSASDRRPNPASTTFASTSAHPPFCRRPRDTLALTRLVLLSIRFASHSSTTRSTSYFPPRSLSTHRPFTRTPSTPSATSTSRQTSPPPAYLLASSRPLRTPSRPSSHRLRWKNHRAPATGLDGEQQRGGELEQRLER